MVSRFGKLMSHVETHGGLDCLVVQEAQICVWLKPELQQPGHFVLSSH